MGDKKRFIAGVMLIAVYAFFFASSNLFFHTHLINDQRIVHSHPWAKAAHSHAAGQVTLIQVLETAAYEEAENLFAPCPIPTGLNGMEVVVPEAAPCSAIVSILPSRAPPALC